MRKQLDAVPSEHPNKYSLFEEQIATNRDDIEYRSTYYANLKNDKKAKQDPKIHGKVLSNLRCRDYELFHFKLFREEVRNTDFTHATFNKCFFEHVLFVNCCFDSASLHGFHFLSCMFLACSFASARFYNSTIDDCNFTEAKFDRTSMFSTKFHGCCFDSSYSRFSPQLVNTSFNYCDFTEELPQNLSITDTQFYRCVFGSLYLEERNYKSSRPATFF